MARRNKPYLPLYVQDFLTDEKLAMCSWETQGIFIKIMCVLHKQKEYGKFLLEDLLKQNLKQNKKICLNFASHFSSHFASTFAEHIVKMLPCQKNEMEKALIDLVNNDVMQFLIDDECNLLILQQKRMVNDSEISTKRSKAGFVGGKKTQDSLSKKNNFASDFAKAKVEANCDNDNDNDNNSFSFSFNLLDSDNKNKSLKKKESLTDTSLILCGDNSDKEAEQESFLGTLVEGAQNNEKDQNNQTHNPENENTPEKITDSAEIPDNDHLVDQRDHETEIEPKKAVSVRQKKERHEWKENYQIYSQLCTDAANAILLDTETIQKLKDVYGDCDIKKSLQAGLLYWDNEEIWKKQRRKSGNINMRMTLINGFKFSIVKKNNFESQCDAELKLQNYNTSPEYINHRKKIDEMLKKYIVGSKQIALEMLWGCVSDGIDLDEIEKGFEGKCAMNARAGHNQMSIISMIRARVWEIDFDGEIEKNKILSKNKNTKTKNDRMVEEYGF